MNLPKIEESTKLSKFVLTGDIVAVSGDSFISKAIQKFTFSKINHLALVFNKEYSFETDLKWMKAGFHNLSRFDGKKILVIRPTFLTIDMRLKVFDLCQLYADTPYSLYDCITNALTFWLKDELRVKLLDFLGNKKFMKCDELVARIIYEVSGHETLKDWEGGNPDYWVDIALQHPNDYQIIYSDF